MSHATVGSTDANSPVQMMSPVAQTMLVPLWARAEEMRKPRPLVHDARALEICESVHYDFAKFRRAYGTQIVCVLRGVLYDTWVSQFLVRYPHGTVVELGAGLSTRFERIDNGTAHWVDIDLPDAMRLRRVHVSPHARRILVEASVLDSTWPAAVLAAAPGPYFLVSEGMFMYLDANDVRTCLTRIADAFGDVELVLDSIAPMVVRHQRFHDSMRHMMDARFRWGVEDIREIEQWDARFRVLDVATLPQIAKQFAPRLQRRHRLVGAVVAHALPRLARAYRLSHVRIK